MNEVLSRNILQQASKLKKFTIEKLWDSINEFEGTVDEKLLIIDVCLSSNSISQAFDVYYYNNN